MQDKDRNLIELENYKKARLREREARLQAETLLEDKTRDLYYANQELTRKFQELELYAEELKLFLSFSQFSQGKITFDSAIQFFIDSICLLEKWPVAHVYLPTGDLPKKFISSKLWHITDEIKFYDLHKLTSSVIFESDVDIPGGLFSTKNPIYIQDIEKISNFHRTDVCKKLGLRSIFCIPLMCYNEIVALVEFFIPEDYCQNKRRNTLVVTFSKQLEVLLERLYAQDEAKENYLKLQQALIELQQLAHNDTLTKLPNRLQFELTLKRQLANAKRYNHKIALLYIDMDNFKLINDQMGHDVGDAILVEFGNRLKIALREGDFAARLGGDEFAVFAQIKSTEDAEHMADRLLKYICTPYPINGREILVSASIGIAGYPKDGRDYTTLYKNSDIAMYKAKEKGKNNYVHFDASFKNQYNKQFVIKNSIDSAMDNGDFFLMYQPIYNILPKKLKGLEVLIRWKHPEYGIISPAEFIPITEENGRIVSLGKWILRTACLQYVAWKEEFGLDCMLLINISARQLSDENFFTSVVEIIKETNMPLEFLEFEITETAIMSHQEKSEDLLRDLRDLGIKIAIDDFGTGYSTLNRLKSLPISSLKIDISFIEDIGSTGNNDLIVKSIIGLAKELNLETIAEGVETEKQLKFLADNNCGSVQGYLFNHPLTTDEIDSLFSNPPQIQSVKGTQGLGS